MMRYLLDTNHISPLVTPGHPLRTHIINAIAAGDEFYIPILALGETLFGIGILPRAVANQQEWERLKPKFTIISINQAMIQQSTALRIALRKRGKQLELVDAIIAITALNNNLQLLTTDKDFQHVPRLQTANWR